jgi:hypothetical protein
MLNEKSYDYLKNQLLYLGFGEEIAIPLKAKMEEGLAEFTLPHARKFGQDETHSVLHFSKSEKDVTFFNRFDLTLKRPGREDLAQTFFVGKEFNYTLQERYNMLDGRFVYREQPKMVKIEEGGSARMVPSGETYFAWRGLDFKQSDQHGNFLPKTMFWDHEKELSRYPVAELGEQYDHMRLLASLEKGNKASVTVIRDGQDIKATVAANPRTMRLDFYDVSGRAMIVSPAQKQKVGRSEKLDGGPREQSQANEKKVSANLVADQKNNKAVQKRRGLHM